MVKNIALITAALLLICETSFSQNPFGFGTFNDPSLDAYKTIGVEAKAKLVDIKAKYHAQARTLNQVINALTLEGIEGDHRMKMANTQFALLNEAYAILSETSSRQAYDEFRQGKAKTPRVANSNNPYNVKPTARPNVFQFPTGEQIKIVRRDNKVNLAFNRSRPVDHWRANMSNNPLYYIDFQSRGESFLTDPDRPIEFGSAERDSLEKKWQNGNTVNKAELNRIYKELQRLTKASQKTKEITSSERAFLYWAFALGSLSDKHVNKMAQFFAAAGPELKTVISEASLTNSDWRNSLWVLQLLEAPDRTLGNVVKAMTFPELLTEKPLWARILHFPDFGEYHYFNFLNDFLPRKDSIFQAELIKWIISQNLAKESGPKFFLRYATEQSHWIEHRPGMFDYILSKIESPSNLEIFIKNVMTKPESAKQTQWLQFLVMNPDPDNFLRGKLNQLLALDHWYFQAEIRQMLDGKAPTVELLQQADWQRSQMLVHEPRLGNVFGIEDKTRKASPNSCRRIFAE